MEPPAVKQIIQAIDIQIQTTHNRSRSQPATTAPSIRTGVSHVIRDAWRSFDLLASQGAWAGPRNATLLLPTRSIISPSTPALLRSPLRDIGGRQCGAPRSRRIGRPDGAGADRCHRIVRRHRARVYGPISDPEITMRARIGRQRLGKRTLRRRLCLPDETGTSVTYKRRIMPV